MTDELTHQQSSTLRFRREVADRFGVLPNFFCSADAAPGLVEELWKFAKSAYLDSPLPSLFKERLFVHLSRFCEIRYCIVRHVGFLIGQGRPAGDADAGPETVEQVIEMLRRPLPEGPALTKVLERLERVSLGGRLPEPRTECETDLFDALTIMFLSPRDSARARAAVRAAVGDATFELLVAYLAFIRTAHYWTEMHPELTYEPDMAEILRGYGELADLLLDKSEAELVQGGVRLRETLNHLKRVEVALLESESRHAFLLRLGDALRLLVDPMAIQGEASRLLGERLLTDRAYYAEIDEAQGYILVERNFVRAGVPSMVGRYSLGDVQLGWSDISDGRTGGRGRHPNLAVDSRRGSSGGRRAQRGCVRRGAVDQGRQAGRGALRERPFTAGLDSRGSRIGQGNRGADLGGHRTRPRRGAVAGSQCAKRRVPGDAGARTEKSARPDTNRPRTDSARRRHRGGGRAGARDDGASSGSHGSLDRRPSGRVENHVRQDCAPTRTNTARRVWSTAPWKPIVPPWLPNKSN